MGFRFDISMATLDYEFTRKFLVAYSIHRKIVCRRFSENKLNVKDDRALFKQFLPSASYFAFPF